jgi:hypothetical protein
VGWLRCHIELMAWWSITWWSEQVSVFEGGVELLSYALRPVNKRERAPERSLKAR